MSDKINQTRTIALVGHGGAGKTSLAEAMLFDAKAVDRRADRHERAVETRTALEVELDVAMLARPVPPADEADFAVDQRMVNQVLR